jgi:hypothetical protein
MRRDYRELSESRERITRKHTDGEGIVKPA